MKVKQNEQIVLLKIYFIFYIIKKALYFFPNPSQLGGHQLV